MSFGSALSTTAVMLNKSNEGSWNETGYCAHAALVVLFAVFVFFLFFFFVVLACEQPILQYIYLQFILTRLENESKNSA